jgi:hypothetical protein
MISARHLLRFAGKVLIYSRAYHWLMTVVRGWGGFTGTSRPSFRHLWGLSANRGPLPPAVGTFASYAAKTASYPLVEAFEGTPSNRVLRTRL